MGNNANTSKPQSEFQGTLNAGKAAGTTVTTAVTNGGKATGEVLVEGADMTKKAVGDVANLITGDDKNAAGSTTTPDKPTDAPTTGEELDEHGKPKKKGKGFFDNFDIGNTAGGLVGALGGWFLGSMFGGGIIGKIAGALLAIGGFFMGKKAMGGTINKWLGRPSNPGNPDAPAVVSNDNAQEQKLTLSEEDKKQIAQAYVNTQMNTQNIYQASNVTDPAMPVTNSYTGPAARGGNYRY